MNQLERIEHMERILDDGQQAIQTLLDAIGRYQAVKPRMAELEAYYTSGLWLRDYEDDCAGKLPRDLKRGVMSEDAVFDLLRLQQELSAWLKEDGAACGLKSEPSSP